MKPRSCSLLVGSGALALLIGCGGGSSGSSASAPTGKAAVRVAALGSYHSLAAGMSFPNEVLRIAAPTGSAIGASPALPGSGLTELAQHARTKALAGKAASRAGGLDYLGILNLYVDETMTAANTLTLTFYSDAAGTAKVGTATLQNKTSATSLLPSTFPSTIAATIDVTGGNLPMKGDCQIVFTRLLGTNTLTGTLGLPKDDLNFNVALTLSDDLQVGGSVTIKEHSQTIQGTHVAGTLDQALTCDATVDPGGAKGTATLDFTKGTVRLDLTSASGTSTAAIDASGNLVVGYPDGTTETISNPLTASVTSTGTVSGGTGGGGTAASYGQAVPFGSANDFYYSLGGDGSLVGVRLDTTNGNYTSLPIYLTSPSGTALTGSNGAYFFTQFNGISAVGTAVGNGNGTAGVDGGTGSGIVPLFWSSLGATPTTLPIPLANEANTLGGSAYGVNAKAQIVGEAVFGIQTVNGFATRVPTAAYWASPTAAPVKLNGIGGGLADNLEGVAISDGGAILGTTDRDSDATTHQWVVWSSPSANAVALDKASLPANARFKLTMNASGVVAGTGSDGKGYVWSPPDYTPVALKLPSGVSTATIAGINDKGEIVGATGKIVVALWTSPTAAPQDVTATNDYASPPFGIANDGTIVRTAPLGSGTGGYSAQKPK